jgi:hypothetical protein
MNRKFGADVSVNKVESTLADVAQSVEQLICNQLVGGSSPSIGSSSLNY